MLNSSAALCRLKMRSAVRKQCHSCEDPLIVSPLTTKHDPSAVHSYLLTYCTLRFPRPESASSSGRAQLGTWMLLKGGKGKRWKASLVLHVMRFCVPSGHADVQTRSHSMQLCKLCARGGSGAAS